ncbi:MAG: cell division protein ZapA [bacterium]|nr:cell division protein ZapA [Candidatus Minthenecus merdequi]
MTVNLNINGKNCKLNVERDEEKTFRDAGRLVEDLIKSYHNRFNLMSSEDVLTRVALDLAVNLVERERELDELEEVL